MPRTIAVLIYPGFQVLDAAGPIAAFEIAERLAPGAYRLDVIAETSGAIPASASGVSMSAEKISLRRRTHTLLISGGDGSRVAMMRPALVRFVQRAARSGARIASVCTGAYILAAAGLLDERPATTHWSRSADLARRFPKVNVVGDRMFTKHGDIWTSAGITAGIDMALALIEDDLGEEIARKTAQYLVVYRRRSGGQSQFSALLELEQSGGRFSSLFDFMRENLSADLSVSALAARAAMSPRNFARAFLAETGVTPAKAVERLRAEAARAALEQGNASVQSVARQSGFGDPERMRRAFVRLFGRAPSTLKAVRAAQGRTQ